MRVRLGLREIERKAWLRTFEHGLWDLAVGLLILSFGISILTQFYWMTAIWVPLGVPIFRDLAKRLVVPRLGHVTFRRRRQRSIFRIQIILALLAVGGLGMFLLTNWSTRANAPVVVQWVRSHMLAVIGAVWGGGLVAAGWGADYPRLYVYGVFLFGVLLGSDLGLAYNMGEGLAAVGSLIALVGAGLFVRFLWKYPRHPGSTSEETHG
jgi:hypothetical protein